MRPPNASRRPTAWDRLDEMERGVGLRLVDRHAGGAGGAYLTATGRDLVGRFNAFAGEVEASPAEHFGQAFADL